VTFPTLLVAVILLVAAIVAACTHLVMVGRSGYLYCLGATAPSVLFMVMATQFGGLSANLVSAASLLVGAVLYSIVLKTSLLRGLAFAVVSTLSLATLFMTRTVLASNTSFEGTRRPVTQFAVANWAPVHHAPQLDR
jgi:hypothetical protein